MKTIALSQNHFETIDKWCKKHEFTLPVHALSNTGFMIQDEKGKSCLAFWLYKTNSPMMFVGWPVSSPGCRGKQLTAAFQEMLNFAENKAKSLQSRLLVVQFGQGKNLFARRLSNSDFQDTGEHYMFVKSVS